ncbi:MAG: hypothetical protein JJU41_07670 [Bacteroidetes bacterium]|nr:hypothetical protein [Bacteroidota bacterium]
MSSFYTITGTLLTLILLAVSTSVHAHHSYPNRLNGPGIFEKTMSALFG